MPRSRTPGRPRLSQHSISLAGRLMLMSKGDDDCDGLSSFIIIVISFPHHVTPVSRRSVLDTPSITGVWFVCCLFCSAHPSPAPLLCCVESRVRPPPTAWRRRSHWGASPTLVPATPASATPAPATPATPARSQWIRKAAPLSVGPLSPGPRSRRAD